MSIHWTTRCVVVWFVYHLNLAIASILFNPLFFFTFSYKYLFIPPFIRFYFFNLLILFIILVHWYQNFNTI